MAGFAHPNQVTLDGSTRQKKLYEDSIDLLKMCEPPEGYYLATSFGKDSIVAQRLCDEAGVKYDAHHNVTGIDPPELVYFGRKFYPDVERIMPAKSIWELIRQKGIPPQRHMRYCCDHLKEDGGLGRHCVMGIRAEESSRRKNSWAPVHLTGRKEERLRLFDPDDIQRQIQACSTRSKWVINPLYQWTSVDLWDFIHDSKLPYCSLYDEGFKRLGCIACPMAKESERRYELERWPGFRRLYVATFQKLIDDGRFQNLKLRNGEEVMEWWLSDNRQEKPINGQINMWDEQEA